MEISLPLPVGTKITFIREATTPYIVKASSEKFAILTRPYNLKRAVIYTIIDIVNDRRGPNNLVFNFYDYRMQKDIDQCLVDLEKGDEGLEVSRRRSVSLDVLKIDLPIKEVILRDAQFNTENGVKQIIDKTTDDYGQRWTKLTRLQDLLGVKELMHPDWQELLESKSNLRQLSREIKAGVTFAFYCGEDKLLRYER